MRVNLKIVLLLGGWALSLDTTASSAEAPVYSVLVESVRAEITTGLGVEAGALCSEVPPAPIARPAIPDASWPSAVVEFVVTEAGSGSSSWFTKSSCLLCVKYMREGQSAARTRASSDTQARCESRGGFLKAAPVDMEINCTRIDGWMSYYQCSARSQATCFLPIRY